MESSRPRTPFELPKPETGLAEWTTKIKAMQRQVDADDEQEQRRLEEEIAASRLARMRRSRTSSKAGSSLDLSKSEEFKSALHDEPTSGDVQPNRQQVQSDTLHKLMGGSPNPGPAPLSQPLVSRRDISPPSLSQPKPEPISLAAFMGGRATGPRLNKHAPQQDAHDPTQFEQRTRISAPHPVFGRGGIAMPGMTGRGQSNTNIVEPRVNAAVTLPAERERTNSTPGITRRYVETLENSAHKAVTPQRTGSAQSGRDRTISSPTKASPVITHDTYSRADSYSRSISRSPALDTRPKTPVQVRQTPVNNFKTPPSSPPAASISRPYTPRQQEALSRSPSSPISKSSVVTPSLARPIRPEPKPSPQGPQIPASKAPSPAFLRAPMQKDPTPSISRLQGRGFVQTMVKVSSQLESTATGSPTNGNSDMGRFSGERRKSAVLDRWQPAATSVSVSPPVSPRPTPIRKSKTMDPSLAPENLAVFSTPSATSSQTAKSLKNVASLPSISQANVIVSTASTPDQLKKKKSVGEDLSAHRTPGLGSSSTLISYIKPVKTGDDPVPAPSPPAPVHETEVDELGVRARHSFGGSTGLADKQSVVAAGRKNIASEQPSPSHKPLSHLTKDRARKPKKARDVRHHDEGHNEVQVVASAPPAVRLGRVSPQPFLNLATSTKPETRAIPSVIVSPSDAHKPTSSPGQSTQNVRSPSPSRVIDRWADQPVIGMKAMPSGKISPQAVPKKPDSGVVGMMGRYALPGLATTSSPSTSDSRQVTSESNVLVDRYSSRAPAVLTPVVALNEEKSSMTSTNPARHARIPSTGNRATVMDVAQALKEHPSPPVIPHQQKSDNDGALDPPRSPVLFRGIRSITPPGMQAEKRKSSYEKYSAITLPPLKEEKTPVPSPAGTLSRNTDPTQLKALESKIDAKGLVESLDGVLASKSTATAKVERVPGSDMNEVCFNHADEVLPTVDVKGIVNAKSPSFTPDPNTQVISVEVMSVTGSIASPVSRDNNVFYDAEVLAIIYRSKSKSTGLVSTRVWAWWGKKCQVGEKEERKLQDLAKRYGTALETIFQHAEPAELVYVLGGQMAIRQGIRAHWTVENTAMHLVRSVNGFIYIDEHDLNVKNLCSGFSYCLSVLDTLYVWYGCGSTPPERRAALEYARHLAIKGASVVELSESENNGDEMFWMILGDGDYARADHWKWRRNASTVDPRLWRINAGNLQQAVNPVTSFTSENTAQSSVYLVDCIWELFVIVGRDARGKRLDIKLAISVAKEMSKHAAPSRPFTPTVHVVVFPTQLPLDLRLSFRDLDEIILNNGEVPNHMNILSCNEALEHLSKSTWKKDHLKDKDMLPLGLGILDIV